MISRENGSLSWIRLVFQPRCRADIPRLLRLYGSGQLRLDELITARYSLDQINAGYRDLREGRNIRGVIAHGS